MEMDTETVPLLGPETPQQGLDHILDRADQFVKFFGFRSFFSPNFIVMWSLFALFGFALPIFGLYAMESEAFDYIVVASHGLLGAGSLLCVSLNLKGRDAIRGFLFYLPYPPHKVDLVFKKLEVKFSINLRRYLLHCIHCNYVCVILLT